MNGEMGLLPIEWSVADAFNTTETAIFNSELQSLLDCTCPGCTSLNGDCQIDFNVTSDSAGIIKLDSLLIEGCIEEPEPPEPPEKCNCSELEERISELEEKFDEIDERVGILEAALEGIQETIDILQEGLEEIEELILDYLDKLPPGLSKRF